MVRIFKVKNAEAEKRLLMAKSEVHRQTLRLEAHNIHLATAGLRKGLLQSCVPYLAIVGPLASYWLARRRGSPARSVASFLGKQIFRRFTSSAIELISKEARGRQ